MIKLGEQYRNITTEDKVTPFRVDGDMVTYRKKEPERLVGTSIIIDTFSKPLRVFEQLYRRVK